MELAFPAAGMSLRESGDRGCHISGQVQAAPSARRPHSWSDGLRALFSQVNDGPRHMLSSLRGLGPSSPHSVS